MFSLLLASLAMALPSSFGDNGRNVTNQKFQKFTTVTPPGVYIQGITYGGTGCPHGSVGQMLSGDGSTFTLIFDSFVASTGPGIRTTESRKNCQINVDMRYPTGWSYSFATVDYRGYAQIPFGMTGIQKSTYYFSGQSQQVSRETPIRGRYNGDFLVHDDIPINQVIWSPCGQTIAGNINAQVRLQSNSGQSPLPSSQITVDSIDGKVKQIYGLQWRRC